ncbi:phosphoglycerate mutase-like protein [Collybia nuda]|uniref:Phosphoglycerate mutase-like protein n=1 Tax=Collybia nuda TaxID=64659 RepID=A0A9P6CBW9_9AGAR|nr:phosphoglycerate mutase-like protein [Collybia nuda]
MRNITYDTVLGYFAQDDVLATGLPALYRYLQDGNTKYKVFFFGRHGEGFHNVGLAKYQRPAWPEYWARLNGDGEIVWGPDPELTAIGISQAVTVNDEWKAEFPFGIPLPEKLYTSPLTRAMKTCEVTFEGILPDDKRRAVVVENCRERHGLHTCDKRRTKSYIQQAFPLFDVEPGLTEHDTLWDEHSREEMTGPAERAKKVLDHIFENDNETFVSVTAHILIIHGFLQCVGRALYEIPTGGVLPVIVKAVHSS